MATRAALRLIPPPQPLPPRDVEDRRHHRRLGPAELGTAANVRIRGRRPAALVNLSPAGALIEAPYQLRPGSRLTIEIATSAGTRDMPLRLLRCHVSELTRGLRYRAACEFDDTLKLPAFRRTADAHADRQRLLQVLEQFQRSDFASDPALERTRFAELLKWVEAASRRSEPRALILTRIEAHLRRAFPTLLISAKSPVPPQDPSKVTQFFGVEFRSSVLLTRSDRRFLRPCAQLISLLSDGLSQPGANVVAPLSIAPPVPAVEIIRSVSDWIEISRRDRR